MNKIAKTIEEYKKLLNITQADIAKELGVAPSTLWFVMKDPSRASFKTAEKFCRAYGGKFNLTFDDFRGEP